MLNILVYNSSLVNWKWQWKLSWIQAMDIDYNLHLCSLSPYISIAIWIQYPLLCLTLYMEYAHHPMPSIQSLLLSLVTLLSTHAYARTVCACRSPHLSYLKFWSQWNCDGTTLWESGWSQDCLVCSTVSSPNLSCSTCFYLAPAPQFMLVTPPPRTPSSMCHFSIIHLVHTALVTSSTVTTCHRPCSWCCTLPASHRTPIYCCICVLTRQKMPNPFPFLNQLFLPPHVIYLLWEALVCNHLGPYNDILNNDKSHHFFTVSRIFLFNPTTSAPTFHHSMTPLWYWTKQASHHCSHWICSSYFNSCASISSSEPWLKSRPPSCWLSLCSMCFGVDTSMLSFPLFHFFYWP